MFLTDQEIALAAELNIPYFGMPANLTNTDTKEESKNIFCTVGVNTPENFGVYFSFEEIYNGITSGRIAYRGTLLLKLNSEEGGNGIAELDVSTVPGNFEIFLERVKINKPIIGFSEFVREVGEQGCLVEVFLSENTVSSPSSKKLSGTQEAGRSPEEGGN